MTSFISTLRQIFSNRNIAVLTAVEFFFMFGGSLWWSFQSLYILALGASKEVLGMLLTLQSATMLVFQIPGGVLADRFGRRKIIIYGSLIRCIPPIIYILANHWALLIPGMLIDSLAALDIPAYNALIVESLPLESRGAGYGAYRTLTSIPRIFTMPLGGILIDSMGVLPGMRLCLMLNEVLLLTAAFIMWRFITETRGGSREVKDRGQQKRERVTVTRRLKMVSKEIWFLIIVGGLSSFASRLSMSFMIVYATQVIKLSATEWGVLGTLFSLISTSITTPTGFLADRIGRKSCILISQTLSLISILGFINSHDFRGVLLSRGLGGVGSGFGGMVFGFMGGPTWQALIADRVPSETRGSIMGLIGTIMGGLAIPSSWIGGYFYENLSPALPFQLSIAVRAAAIVIFILSVKEPEERAR